MELVPLQDRIIVNPIKKDKTSSGLYIPDSPSESMIGDVISAGPEAKSFSGKKGPIKVIFNAEKLEEASIGGEKIFSIRESDIIAIIKNN